MDRMLAFKDQSVEELKALYQELSRDIFELRNEISINKKIEKPHLVKQKKRQRARLLTVLRQKGGKIE